MIGGRATDVRRIDVLQAASTNHLGKTPPPTPTRITSHAFDLTNQPTRVACEKDLLSIFIDYLCRTVDCWQSETTSYPLSHHTTYQWSRLSWFLACWIPDNHSRGAV